MGLTKLDIFLTILIILITIGFIALLIILLVTKPEKYSEHKVNEVIIPSFTSLNFNEYNSTPNYTEINLGLAGRLILDCYTGKCPKKEYYYDSDNELRYSIKEKLDYSCSEQCSYNGKSYCGCDDPDKKSGKCTQKYDDFFVDGKYCYADNVIYFWKGKRYQISSKRIITYNNDAILKDEECPKGKKLCGIIDNKENKLCITSSSECPINYISENKLDNNKAHSTIMIGNKTFYYTYDDDMAKNRKIIAGLVADSDLYLNKDNDKKVLLDNYTISGFLKDNPNLYREVNLGYDPYQVENIDQKGNSYLRIYYSEGIDLSDLRNKIKIYNSNAAMNKKYINPTNKKIKYTSVFGFISCGALLGLIICGVLYCRGDLPSRTTGIIPLFCFIFFLFIILSLIYSAINISNLNELYNIKPSDNNRKISRIINIIIVILCCFLFVFIIFLIVYVSELRDYCCKRCCCCCDRFRKNEDNTHKSTEISDIAKNSEKDSGLNINK